jgi:hypothetical protein
MLLVVVVELAWALALDPTARAPSALLAWRQRVGVGVGVEERCKTSLSMCRMGLVAAVALCLGR